MGMIWMAKDTDLQKEKAEVVIFNCIRKRNKEEATCSLADYFPTAQSGWCSEARRD